jgi:hypothetical protein
LRYWRARWRLVNGIINLRASKSASAKGGKSE